MKSYETAQIRNVALIGHGSSGKTSLMEAMMYQTGVVGRIGRVEPAPRSPIPTPMKSSAKFPSAPPCCPCSISGVKLNILDMPGYADFIGEVVGAVACG